MQLPCPYCRQPIDCASVAPGQAIRCPYCQAGLQMPGAPAAQVSLPPAPAPVVSLPAAQPKSPARVNWPTTKATGDPDGFIRMSPTTTLAIVGGILLVVVLIVASVFASEGARRREHNAKLGINEQEQELAKQLAMQQVAFYLAEKPAPTFKEPIAELLPGGAKRYRVRGKVRAHLGKGERWLHNYAVELRFDPTVPQGFVCHSVFVGGTSYHSNPYIRPKGQ